MRKFSCILLALLTACISIGSTAASATVAGKRAIAVDTAIAYDDTQDCRLVVSSGRVFLTGDTSCVVQPRNDGEELEDGDEGEELIYGKSLYYDEITNYDFSDYEKELMAEIVLAEAGTEPFEGKIAVAAVILNRYFGWHASSIEELIYAPNQFAPPACYLHQDPREEEIVQAVELACKGSDPICGLCHFVADYCEWQPDCPVIKIGHHIFY